MRTIVFPFLRVDILLADRHFFSSKYLKKKANELTLFFKVLFYHKLYSMKISRTKFVIAFLVSALAFQFISNSVLGPEVRLFPANGEWFPGAESSIGWKSTLAKILYPIKYILIKPLSFLGQDKDAAPPILLVAFALYWSVIAIVFHYLLCKIFNRKKHE